MITTSNTECTVFMQNFSYYKYKVIRFQYSTDAGETWKHNPQNIDTSRSLIVTNVKNGDKEMGITPFMIQCIGDIACIMLIDDNNENSCISINEGNTRVIYDVVAI